MWVVVYNFTKNYFIYINIYIHLYVRVYEINKCKNILSSIKFIEFPTIITIIIIQGSVTFKPKFVHTWKVLTNEINN